jgi:hypothetical protein
LDEIGTFVVGGSDTSRSFRGFISQMDVYRRIALTYEQVWVYRFDFEIKLFILVTKKT